MGNSIAFTPAGERRGAMTETKMLIIFAIFGLALAACSGGGQTVQHQTLGPGGQAESYDAPAWNMY